MSRLNAKWTDEYSRQDNCHEARQFLGIWQSQCFGITQLIC
jgi:hypothetical protein